MLEVDTTLPPLPLSDPRQPLPPHVSGDFGAASSDGHHSIGQRPLAGVYESLLPLRYGEGD